MNNTYKMAARILSNLKLSSDNIDMEECYYLCANKQHIEDIRVRDHQIVWGRRGTGKTTLLKAFVYDINNVQQELSTLGIYIVMSKAIPTDSEIAAVTGDGSSLAIYVFSKLIEEICKELEKVFELRGKILDRASIEQFMKTFYQLQDYLMLYKTCIQGGEISIDNIKSKEIKNEIGRDLSIGAQVSAGILESCVNFIRKHSKIDDSKHIITIKGTLKFKLETQIVNNLITQMLDALGITLTYICLDEYSEIDKVSEYTIQGKVAQLIKQVFFKSSMYSVKIATIWNKSKLHVRGGNRIEGIEYQQDIFAGPDLDIMFMGDNADVISYFKELLVNTYLMGDEVKAEEKQALSDYIENSIFGKTGLRHIICGSQGVSRSFVILAKSYLQRFIKNKGGLVRLGNVYEIIKNQYMENVRNKVPYYSIYGVIETFVTEKLCRYFLITRSDYNRCKEMIMYLSSRGVFMQMPGHLTRRSLRDKYKLFIIHYGSYLDALENDSYKIGRKKLEDDAKLEANGMLMPEYDEKLVNAPEYYTVHLPKDSENEVYCTDCNKIFISDPKGGKIICPYCNKETLRFADFINEVSL